eukprot:6503359-Prymnesium_polylepis.1
MEGAILGAHRPRQHDLRAASEQHEVAQRVIERVVHGGVRVVQHVPVGHMAARPWGSDGVRWGQVGFHWVTGGHMG